jgi:hypothetical protein
MVNCPVRLDEAQNAEHFELQILTHLSYCNTKGLCIAILLCSVFKVLYAAAFLARQQSYFITAENLRQLLFRYFFSEG